jgi:RNA polymerase sigma factor (sigma-70 family)
LSSYPRNLQKTVTVKDYNEAVDTWSDGIFRFAVKTLRQKMLAEDIVQEAFARLWEKRETVQAGKVKSYLFQTAYNLMVDHFRHEKRYSDAPMPSLPQAENHAPDLKETLDKALMTLPEIQRTVVMLRDYEGYNYEEIGQITGLGESQVKVYIFRARQALKAYIGSIHQLI